MRKQIVSIFMAAVMAGMALSGCGKTADGGSSSSSPTNSGSEQQESSGMAGAEAVNYNETGTKAYMVCFQWYRYDVPVSLG